MQETVKILIGSTNKKKREEIANIINDLPVQFSLLSDFNNVPDIIEDGKTFKDNAIKKAVGFARWQKTLTVADDSGLEVCALDNRPGVFSARYAGEGATDAMLMTKLLGEMQSIPKNDRIARFKCAIALANPQGLLFVVEAECRGIITKEHRGSNGFGYDPLFYFPGFGKTFAEITAEEKNQVSHRAKALALFKEKLKAMFNL
ncbi:MAG: XTP/dITP diphosphatase [Candidatus Anammoxibacter sp.]